MLSWEFPSCATWKGHSDFPVLRAELSVGNPTVPRSIHHLPNLLLSSFLWSRPSSSREMSQFYQQNPEQSEQHVLWWSRNSAVGRRKRSGRRGGRGAPRALKHEDVRNKHHKNITGLLCVFYSTVRPIQAGSAQSMYQPSAQGPSSQEAETSPASSSCYLRQNNPAGSLLCHGGLSSWLFPHWISLFPFWQKQ